MSVVRVHEGGRGEEMEMASVTVPAECDREVGERNENGDMEKGHQSLTKTVDERVKK